MGLSNWLFKQVHGKNLVYNTCWEDPRCDRQLLELDADSEVVMITSAGCNALDYLLDDPKKIHCIDINPRQNALLELKLANFKGANYDSLFQFFGKGKTQKTKEQYDSYLRPYLSSFARKFWDKHLYYFKGNGIRKSFYYHGTSGLLAWSTVGYFRLRRSLYRQVQYLMASTSLERQAALYKELENRVLNPITGWFLNRHAVMCLAGVPSSQQKLFVEKYDNGVLGFVQECFEQIFTKIPVKDNYFWQLYLNGSYTEDCCPEYLKKNNFETLKERADRVETHSMSVSQFLINRPGKYSHFILLDHQDWLASNDKEELEREWRLILQNSKKGTKILLRSAAHEVDFFPDFVKKAVDFKKEEILDIHQQDRVGTYASVYLGVVKSKVPVLSDKQPLEKPANIRKRVLNLTTNS